MYDEVVVSLGRMNKIISINEASGMWRRGRGRGKPRGEMLENGEHERCDPYTYN